MADSVHTSNTTIKTGSLLHAAELARSLVLQAAPNGLRYTAFGDTKVDDKDLERIVQAVPTAMVPALGARAFYFVPLALPANSDESQPRTEGHRSTADQTLISPIFTPELSDEAICHRNVAVEATDASPAHEGVFISARLLRDQFALAFEFFINVGHAFVGDAGIPEAFGALAWSQAVADIRGETSQDAWESRNLAIANRDSPERSNPDEKSRTDFIESAFADAVAIYLLSLAIDFDYAELREREYPLLAPNALADRLRLVAKLFPPNAGYEFSIRYRRRA